MKSSHNQKGFNIKGLLISFSILIFLMAVTSPLWFNTAEKAKAASKIEVTKLIQQSYPQVTDITPNCVYDSREREVECDVYYVDSNGKNVNKEYECTLALLGIFCGID